LIDPREESLHARALTGVFPPLVGDTNGSLTSTVSNSKHIEQLVRA